MEVMNTKTPEERAEERFPAFKVMDWTRRQDGYATCIREEVEPLEAEVVKLRALVQELTKAGDSMKESIGQVAYELEEGMPLTDESSCIIEAERMVTKWDAAKEHGFVPTNTKEDNG